MLKGAGQLLGFHGLFENLERPKNSRPEQNTGVAIPYHARTLSSRFD